MGRGRAEEGLGVCGERRLNGRSEDGKKEGACMRHKGGREEGTENKREGRRDGEKNVCMKGGKGEWKKPAVFYFYVRTVLEYITRIRY